MGNSESTTSPDSDDDENVHDPFDGIDTLGYRVLGVQPNSPAAEAGLVSFLDFLVGANEKMLLGSGEGLQEGEEYDDIDLPSFLEEHKDKPVEFLVWNIKSQQQRLVALTPSDTWGGAGLLGVTIRLDNYAGAEDRLIRLLEIESPQAPAAVAGLVPFKDFLLGTTSETLDNPSTLAAILQQNEDRVVELYVYNCDSDMVRVVALMPTRSWESSRRAGLLGAEVGIGYLHRLPHAVRQTEGASVQRKVRYVGTTTTSSSKPLSKNSKQQHVLELEPQLEMEQPEEERSTRSGDMDSVALDDNVSRDIDTYPIVTPESTNKRIVVETVQIHGDNDVVVASKTVETTSSRKIQDVFAKPPPKESIRKEDI